MTNVSVANDARWANDSESEQFSTVKTQSLEEKNSPLRFSGEKGNGNDYIGALRNINLEVEQGEVLGIIGKNGAGKSTLLKILSKVTPPTTGTVSARGWIASLLEVGTGFHPEMTGRENIFMNGAIMGMTKAEILKKFDEIVIYKAFDNADFQIEVRIEDENVWLNRNQIALLFDRDVKTIGKHIANALKEELRSISVVAKFATTANDGKVYLVEYYNLDMIISVGYRVKSQRGIQFRIWANKVLKEYLIKGHVTNQRIDKIEHDVYHLKKKVDEFDFRLKTNLPPNEGIFYDGQIFDAYLFVIDLLKSAGKSIVLIDNYVDESVRMMFSKRKPKVKATIYTSAISAQLKLDANALMLNTLKLR